MVSSPQYKARDTHFDSNKSTQNVKQDICATATGFICNPLRCFKCQRFGHSKENFLPPRTPAPVVRSQSLKALVHPNRKCVNWETHFVFPKLFAWKQE
ncbi:hypothetical protein AVEN_36653-1 [Araneus ventricosus]|uniref:Uncharacterized protein n=1 Tax=Araneus ventricosus TaxID=182803 RepID=A0A4Y2FY34_ARAVE|nr:hypothetical protein AVEN_36653-1 [Araneus ventricosus]